MDQFSFSDCINVFGYQSCLNLNSQKRVSTMISKVFSIIFITLAVLILVQNLTEFNKYPMSTHYRKLVQESEYQKVEFRDFPLIIEVQDSKQQSIMDKNYYDVIGNHKRHNLGMRYFYFEQCNYKDFKKFSYIKEFQNREFFDNKYCIKDKDKLMTRQESIQLTVDKCMKNKQYCNSFQQYQSKNLDKGFIKIFYLDTETDIENQNSPMKDYLKTLTYSFNYNSVVEQLIQFENYQLQNIYSFGSSQMSQVKLLNPSNPIVVEKEQESIAVINLSFSVFQQIQIRHYDSTYKCIAMIVSPIWLIYFIIACIIQWINHFQYGEMIINQFSFLNFKETPDLKTHIKEKLRNSVKNIFIRKPKEIVYVQQEQKQMKNNSTTRIEKQSRQSKQSKQQNTKYNAHNKFTIQLSRQEFKYSQQKKENLLNRSEDNHSQHLMMSRFIEKHDVSDHEIVSVDESSIAMKQSNGVNDSSVKNGNKQNGLKQDDDIDSDIMRAEQFNDRVDLNTEQYQKQVELRMKELDNSKPNCQQENSSLNFSNQCFVNDNSSNDSHGSQSDDGVKNKYIDIDELYKIEKIEEVEEVENEDVDSVILKAEKQNKELKLNNERCNEIKTYLAAGYLKQKEINEQLTRSFGNINYLAHRKLSIMDYVKVAIPFIQKPTQNTKLSIRDLENEKQNPNVVLSILKKMQDPRTIFKLVRDLETLKYVLLTPSQLLLFNQIQTPNFNLYGKGLENLYSLKQRLDWEICNFKLDDQFMDQQEYVKKVEGIKEFVNTFVEKEQNDNDIRMFQLLADITDDEMKALYKE